MDEHPCWSSEWGAPGQVGQWLSSPSFPLSFFSGGEIEQKLCCCCRRRHRRKGQITLYIFELWAIQRVPSIFFGLKYIYDGCIQRVAVNFLTRCSSDVPKLPIKNLAGRSSPVVSRLDEEGMENLEAVCSVARSSASVRPSGKSFWCLPSIQEKVMACCSSMMETLETSWKICTRWDKFIKFRKCFLTLSELRAILSVAVSSRVWCQPSSIDSDTFWQRTPKSETWKNGTSWRLKWP